MNSKVAVEEDIKKLRYGGCFKEVIPSECKSNNTMSSRFVLTLIML